MKNGKAYELLIERLYRQLEPNAKIIQDDYIFGRNSDTKRQIDVSIRYKFLGIDHLIIVQAKDYTRPAGIKTVDELLSVVKDVNASKGILICAKGFTKKAKDYAKNVGIELLTIHAAHNKNWETEIKIRVKKTIHNFNVDIGIEIGITDLAGKPMNFYPDYFSHDKVKILEICDIITYHIISKHPWKEIRKGRKFKLDFREFPLYCIINEEFRPLDSGYIEIQLTKSKVQGFLVTPENYVYQVDHLKNNGILHNLIISVDSLQEIISPDYNPKEVFDPEAGYDLEIVTFNYKKEGFSSKILFQVKGGISGQFFIKGDILVPLNDRTKEVIELEQLLSRKR